VKSSQHKTRSTHFVLFHCVSKEKLGADGLLLYCSLTIFGKERPSPRQELGTELFFGAKRFPHDGTHFTFNLSSQLGAEYRLKNQDRVRVSYGHLHHSNNNTLSPNPGEDGNGFHMAYVRFWK
jgi:Lipid A 3-O-deacylase (PagL)